MNEIYRVVCPTIKLLREMKVKTSVVVKHHDYNNLERKGFI